MDLVILNLTSKPTPFLKIESLEVTWRDSMGLLPVAKALALAGRPLRALILEDCVEVSDSDFDAQTIESLREAVCEVKLVSLCYRDGWKLTLYTGLEETRESDYEEFNPTCERPEELLESEEPDDQEDSNSSIWDTDTEHSVESGEWARCDDEVVLLNGVTFTPSHISCSITPLRCQRHNPRLPSSMLVQRNELHSKNVDELSKTVLEERRSAYTRYLVLMQRQGVELKRAEALWEEARKAEDLADG